MARDTKRITQLIESILTLASPKSSSFQPHRSTEIIDEALLLVDTKLKENNIKTIKKYEKTPWIIGNKGQLKQVFLNIFLNAIQAMTGKEGNRIEIVTKEIKDYIRIGIRDNGPGIEKRILDRLFDPFFTTRRAEGTGLGLTLSRRIIEEHKGTIKVSSEVGKGTVFSVNLPIAEGDS